MRINKYGENRINWKIECLVNIGVFIGYFCGLNDFLMWGIFEYFLFKEVIFVESRCDRFVWFLLKE